MPDTLDYRSVRELLTIPEMYIPLIHFHRKNHRTTAFHFLFVIPPGSLCVTVFVDVFFFCTVEFLAVCIIAACAADGGAAHINTHARKNNNILLTHICLFCFLIIAFFYDFIYYLLFLPVLTAISLSFLFTILLRSQFDQTVVFQFTSSDRNSQQSSPLPLHSLQTPYKIEFLHCRVNP